MALCPFAERRPVPAHSGARTARMGVVGHVTAGHASPYGQFGNPANQASAHFCVMADGTVEQYVDTDLIAWAEMSGNSLYISIETEGLPTEALTAAQMASLAKLIAWCHDLEHVWPLTMVDHGGTGVTTHAHWPSGHGDPAWGNHACPGPLRSAQLAQIVNALAAAPPPPSSTTPEVDMILIRSDSGAVAVYNGASKQWLPDSESLGDFEARLGQPVQVSDAFYTAIPDTVPGTPPNRG
jgi:hypothetical protein